MSSTAVPAITVAVWTQAYQANKGQRSALNHRARHHSGWLGPHRSSEQRGEQCPHLSWLAPQWLAEPLPTERTEDRGTLSSVVPATTVAVWPHAEKVNIAKADSSYCRFPHL